MADKQKTQNNVHSDQIWRQKINYELHTASAWEKNWGFMRTTANAVKLPPIYKHDARRSGLPSRQAPGLDKNLILSYNIPEVIKTKSLNEKYHVCLFDSVSAYNGIGPGLEVAPDKLGAVWQQCSWQGQRAQMVWLS